MNNYCPNCGNKIESGYNVCPNCGYNIRFGGSENIYNNQSFNPSNQQKTNTLAVIGFVFSLVFGGLIGFILSLIALNQIKKTQEGGRGFAVAGIVISLIRILITILYIVFAILFTVRTVDDYRYDTYDDYYNTSYEKSTFFYSSEKLLNEVTEIYLSNIVLTGSAPEGTTCIKYKTEASVNSEGKYIGWVWADYTNQNDVKYGISMKDDTYQINETVSFASDLSFDDVEYTRYDFKPSFPYYCYDYTKEYIESHTNKNTRM